MIKKAKIVLKNETFIIAEKSVADATKLLTSGVVDIPTKQKDYVKTLNTINIGEKTVPAYNLVDTTVAVAVDAVARVVEATDDEAMVYTGTAGLPDPAPVEDEDTEKKNGGDIPTTPSTGETTD